MLDDILSTLTMFCDESLIIASSSLLPSTFDCDCRNTLGMPPLFFQSPCLSLFMMIPLDDESYWSYPCRHNLFNNHSCFSDTLVHRTIAASTFWQQSLMFYCSENLDGLLLSSTSSDCRCMSRHTLSPFCLCYHDESTQPKTSICPSQLRLAETRHVMTDQSHICHGACNIQSVRCWWILNRENLQSD